MSARTISPAPVATTRAPVTKSTANPAETSTGAPVGQGRGRPPTDGPAPTAEQVCDLARGLPFTKQVLATTLERSTASQRRFLATVLNAEVTSRAAARQIRLMREAGFPSVKTLAGYDFTQITWPADWRPDQLKSLGFIDAAEDLVLYGDVGTGKTHLGIAIGTAAVSAGIPTRFFTAASLVDLLHRAAATDRLENQMARIRRARLLIIDELGYLPIDIQGARLLFKVIAEAYETRSIIFTSNLEFSRWGTVFGDDQMAAAIIDRIIHHGRMLRFTGQSWRVRHGAFAPDRGHGVG